MSIYRTIKYYTRQPVCVCIPIVCHTSFYTSSKIFNLSDCNMRRLSHFILSVENAMRRKKTANDPNINSHFFIRSVGHSRSHALPMISIKNKYMLVRPQDICHMPFICVSSTSSAAIISCSRFNNSINAYILEMVENNSTNLHSDFIAITIML